MANYNFAIVYTTGQLNTVADALLQYPYKEEPSHSTQLQINNVKSTWLSLNSKHMNEIKKMYPHDKFFI